MEKLWYNQHNTTYLRKDVTMNKIILFYKYVAIQYPKQIMKWQQEICQNLELVGRILISHEGINGTLGGSAQNLDQYISLMLDHELFGGIDFKESAGGPECFPRLSIKVRAEAVSLGIPYDQLTPRNGGQHLTPKKHINSSPITRKTLSSLIHATIMNGKLAVLKMHYCPISKTLETCHTILMKILISLQTNKYSCIAPEESVVNAQQPILMKKI